MQRQGRTGRTDRPGRRFPGHEGVRSESHRDHQSLALRCVDGNDQCECPGREYGQRPANRGRPDVGNVPVALDGTIVSTAMPRIAGELGGFSLYAWVPSIYLLTTAVTTPIYGKLSDLFGRK